MKRKHLPLRYYASRHLALTPKLRGVNVVAFIRAETGLGEAARGMALALEAAQIPFNIVNLEYSPSRHEDLSWAHKEVAVSDYDITLIHVNPDSRLALRTRVPSCVLSAPYVIGNWVWELPEFPDEWMGEFGFVNEVWTPSRFSQEAISMKSPVPVVRIPYVVRLQLNEPYSRRDFDLPDCQFVFLVMFDMRSAIERKNPLGAVNAFMRAFPRKVPNVGLVLKITNSDYQTSKIQALKEEIGQRKDITIIDRVMDREKVNALIAVSDCFVSLHRSEGFGLGPAEAMSLAKPVIATNWSGNTDYMTRDNSIGIDYNLVELREDYDHYKSRQYWADPDIGQAAYWMRRVFDEPDLATTLGRRGQETIRNAFSPKTIGNRVRQRLEYIMLNG